MSGNVIAVLVGIGAILLTVAVLFWWGNDELAPALDDDTPDTDDARPEYHDEFGRSTDPNACGCAHCNLVVAFVRSLMQPASWDAGLAELHGETA